MTTKQELKRFKEDIYEDTLNDLDKCSQLCSLNLRYCKLKHDQIWIKLRSKKVLEIQELKLNYTDLQGKFHGLAEFIVLKKVQKFSVIDTCIQPDDLLIFEDELFKQDRTKVQLCFLNFMHNTIEPGGFRILSRICNILPQTIHLLDVTNCKLDDEAVETFLKTISKGKVIKSLIMDGNDGITSNGMVSVGRVAVKCKTETLSLSVCSMEDEHLVRIAEASPKTLRHLRLSENMRLSPDGIINLFKKWGWLKTVDIKECWFGGKYLEKLGKELVGCQVISEEEDELEIYATRSEDRKGSDSTVSATEGSSDHVRVENQIPEADRNDPTDAQTTAESTQDDKPYPDMLQTPPPPRNLLAKFDDQGPGKFDVSFSDDQPNHNKYQLTLYNSKDDVQWRMVLTPPKCHFSRLEMEEGYYIGVCAINSNGVKSEETRSKAIDGTPLDWIQGSIFVRWEKNPNAVKVTFDCTEAQKYRQISLKSEYCYSNVHAIHANDKKSKVFSTTLFQPKKVSDIHVRTNNPVKLMKAQQNIPVMIDDEKTDEKDKKTVYISLGEKERYIMLRQDDVETRQINDAIMAIGESLSSVYMKRKSRQLCLKEIDPGNIFTSATETKTVADPAPLSMRIDKYDSAFSKDPKIQREMWYRCIVVIWLSIAYKKVAIVEKSDIY